MCLWWLQLTARTRFELLHCLFTKNIIILLLFAFSRLARGDGFSRQSSRCSCWVGSGGKAGGMGAGGEERASAPFTRTAAPSRGTEGRSPCFPERGKCWATHPEGFGGLRRPSRSALKEEPREEGWEQEAWQTLLPGGHVPRFSTGMENQSPVDPRVDGSELRVQGDQAS